MTMNSLLIFGLGYSGTAVAAVARDAGFRVTGTARDPAAKPAISGIEIIAFADAAPAVAAASHVLVTAAPDEGGCPVLKQYGETIAAAAPRWIGYYSTTGVYGDRQGGTVDEATAPAPGSARARRRVAAEGDWAKFAGSRAVDIMRLAGIYGPERSVLDELRQGTERRIIKPDHKFSRIHRDDIAMGTLAAMQNAGANGLRVLNFADDEPAASAEVIEWAAALLGLAPPPAVPFEVAEPRMSDMARSFWAENRIVDNARTKEMLGIGWRYPSYREGLRAILAGSAAEA
jgi:nucleoside-diphosphate-sugar epimerase